MSDGENDNELPEVKPESNGAAPASDIAAQLVVTMMKGGMVNVSYPNNEVVGRYLLHKANDIVNEAYRQANAPLVQPPGNFGKGGLMRRMGGR